jgi:hypothetical protein
MIKQNDFVRTRIENVKAIYVDPPEEKTPLPRSKVITVKTEQNETFELVLVSDRKRKLRFRKKPADYDWITPNVYRGEKVHEEEERKFNSRSS